MGVQGLWELLAPVGRRVSVETLSGKKLAIDASIWMVQFMKAMRDEKGEMIRNAHLLGFFRRICKLLFLRTKPVFVFDGGTPALKRRTVIARRRQRENAQAKVRKTAEKLLLNHLKALKLKELANNIKDQRLKQKSDAKGHKKSNQMAMVGSDLGRINMKELGETSGAKSTAVEDISLRQPMVSGRCTREELDEMLAASLVVKEVGILADKEVLSATMNLSEEGDGDDEMILPVSAEVDPTVLAALPQSMQLDILAQHKGKIVEGLPKNVDGQKQPNFVDNGKGKGLLFSEADKVGGSSQSDVISRTYNQDKVDEMLAASIAAEEKEKLVNNASPSAGPFISEDEDGNYDEDEEMIVPEMHGKVDPAVLASLPPSMQLDLLVQMRERLIAENRQKYQKVKKDPSKFSELQIQAYLKTVAFRREIDGVQKAAAGAGVDGVQTSRIASEANREYIFSSSFAGDKRELTSARLEKAKDTQQKTPRKLPSQHSVNSIAQANNSNASSESVSDEPQGTFDDSIQTYLDERGRFRVSRLRAMGLRMTRDIQRNLDLMKEIEEEGTDVDRAANVKAVLNAQKSDISKISGNKLTGISSDINADLVENNNENLTLERDTSIEISFEDDGENKFLDGDDDFFASLVAGNSGTISFADNTSSKEHLCDSSSDCDWEEGIIQDKSNLLSADVKGEVRPPVLKDENSIDSDVEWEEGDCGNDKSTLSCPTELAKAPSQGSMEDEANLLEAMGKNLESIRDGKLSGGRSALCLSESGKVPNRGCLEEEADLQEAIRRSLESVENRKFKCTSSVDDLDEHLNYHEVKLDYLSNQDGNLIGSRMNNVTVLKGESHLLREDSNEPNESVKILDGDKMLDNVARNNLQTSHFSGMQSKSFEAYNSGNMRMLISKSGKMDIGSHSEDLLIDENERMENEVHRTEEQFLDTEDKDGKVFTDCNESSKVDPLGVAEEEKNNCNNEVKLLGKSHEISKPAPLMDTSLKGLAEDLITQLEFPGEDNIGNCYDESRSKLGKEAERLAADFSADVTELNLEEEMQILGQEYAKLENEQRKLERDAESVNSELFTECQELLQMFGLPYIIAPMEAEAQCAYLELAGLVDGVVTDDCDVLLFGARSVYKNIFDERKYVETYLMEDIEKELGLSREKLIRMALLLGSDYTEGVSGIGIVNAIEVVNAFAEADGLLKFREWVESPDPTILGRFDAKSGSSSRKRGSKAEGNIGCSNSNTEESTSDQSIFHAQEEKDSSHQIQETKQIFMDKHRNVSKNWHIPSSFPSETVISAYTSPQVDRSTERFAWGKPDHPVLRKLCWEKFGWTTQKADELLLPVLKEYNKHETQLRLEAFYTFNERFAKIRSKRIKKAVKGITGNQPSELIADFADDLSKSRKVGRGSSVESKQENGIEENLASKNNSKMEHLRKRKNVGDSIARMHSRKKRSSNGPSSDTVPSEVENTESYMQTGEDKNSGKALSSKRRGRGRASAKGRARGRGVGVERGRRKETLGFESSETSSSDGGNEDDGQSVNLPEVLQDVRRSTRSRKPVNYSMKDVEDDDANGSFDQSNKTVFPEEAIEENLSRIHVACGKAATVPNRERDSTTIKPSPEKDLSRDYLELGGGFCADDGETTHQGSSTYDISFDDASSKDYLKFGGGFCEDDSGRGNNQSEIHVTAATLEDSADLPHRSGFLVEDECKGNSVDQFNSGIERAGHDLQDEAKACKENHSPGNGRSNYNHSEMGVFIPENALDNTENSQVGLSAMPFLRKKKRKT